MPRPASGDSLYVELGGSLPPKYEFYREYHPPPEDLENGPPCLKQWIVKRRTDGKVRRREVTSKATGLTQTVEIRRR